MTAATWLTMVLILGFVWGGFVLALATAIRKEGAKAAGERKAADERTSGDAHRPGSA